MQSRTPFAWAMEPILCTSFSKVFDRNQICNECRYGYRRKETTCKCHNSKHDSDKIGKRTIYHLYREKDLSWKRHSERYEMSKKNLEFRRAVE